MNEINERYLKIVHQVGAVFNQLSTLFEEGDAETKFLIAGAIIGGGVEIARKAGITLEQIQLTIEESYNLLKQRQPS